MTNTRDDRDLERLLRTTMQTAANSVEDGPHWAPAGELPVRHGRRRWAGPLLAAAAVAAVATTVVVAAHGPDRHRGAPAATPTAHSTATPTSPAPAPATTACQAKLPLTWRAALTAGTTRAGAASAFPLALLPDGRMLVSRDFGNGRDVALLSPSGSAQSVYTVPQPDLNTVTGATVAGRWAVVPVLREPRDSNGVDPTVVRVVVLDLRTGKSRTIASVREGQYREATHVIDGATLAGGSVYYDVRPQYAKSVGTVHRYDIAAGHDSTVAVARIGSQQGPRLLAGGVSWGDDGIDVPRPLPDPVVAAAQTAVTDGYSYAWRDGHQRVSWVDGPRSAAFAVRGHGAVSIIAVAGPIVFFGDQDVPVRALDARSGAVVALPGMQPYAVAGDGVLAAYAFADSLKQSPTEVVRLDTAALPELHC